MKIVTYDPVPYEGVKSDKWSKGRIEITCDTPEEYFRLKEEIMNTKIMLERFKE